MPRLENWTKYRNTDGSESFGGNVFDHPHFEDGVEVRTSRIVFHDELSHKAKTQSGSEYTLGQPADTEDDKDGNKPEV